MSSLDVVLITIMAVTGVCLVISYLPGSGRDDHFHDISSSLRETIEDDSNDRLILAIANLLDGMAIMEKSNERLATSIDQLARKMKDV